MPPRRPPPRKQYHHGDLRNALLKAAREVLEERGPSYLGLREVSRRVGVSAPSAYHHFPSRDALNRFCAGRRVCAGQESKRTDINPEDRFDEIGHLVRQHRRNVVIDERGNQGRVSLYGIFDDFRLRSNSRDRQRSS